MKHTIFTPVYNRAGNMFDLAKHISEIDYSKSNFEWLIIDDGSTDGTAGICDEYASKHTQLPTIKVFHKKNEE